MIFGNMASGAQPCTRGRERGLALLIVLWVIVAMALLVSSFSVSVRSSIGFVTSEVKLSGIEALLDGGVEVAAARLIDQNQKQRWRPNGRSHTVRFEDYELTISIRDANGLVDLNKADKDLLHHLLRQFTESEQRAVFLRDHILEARGVSKAKQDDLRTDAAARPDPLPSLPFIDVGQLRSIEGMTPEIFRRISPFVTVYSKDGRIGPWAAPDEVLAAIPNMTRGDIGRLRDAQGSRKATEAALASMSERVGSYLVDEPGPAFIVAVAARRAGEPFSAGKLYVIATGIDTEAPYRLLAEQPLGSAQVKVRKVGMQP
jgi:general secretion pathway protein K